MVNILDIMDEDVPKVGEVDCRLQLMFARQQQIADQFLPVEEYNHLRWSSDCPVELDDKFGQAQLKDFSGRYVEELSEAWEALDSHENYNENNHLYEELMDATHFLIEYCIHAGITSHDMPHTHGKTCRLMGTIDEVELHFPLPRGWKKEEAWWEPVARLNIANGFLKMRPWKKTHMKTDRARFKNAVVASFIAHVRLLIEYDLTADEIFAGYWKKSEVNKFRIQSNY